ncbi:ThiF family adenylyltransferase [Flavobacterium sp. HBTb2-11-1]|uniref:ThiF family adenylyltransferase n=1 Tax=Flavobacterium sp. HBTb2-11-1 TaxID=2692212 RepID=UPI0013708A46|nr:ThiF family adenylyltransferase [Flavobacterium sp. HBTb2-11-1]MXO04444.1 hypothetical protein [Flavobacterium sp. HBTb2-11-1]
MQYSIHLEAYSGQLSAKTAEAVEQVKAYFNDPSLQVFVWDEHHIVIAASYNVSLPARGSIDNNILAVEPILVKIALHRYPEAAPLIMSDRKTFPKSRLPHLYYSDEGKPAVLCLVRGSLNEWFATKTIGDLLIIAAQWFFKAATGTLVTDNNEFDPVRLNTSLGKHVFKYETFRDIVSENRRFVDSYPLALILSSAYTGEAENERAFKSISDIPFISLDKFREAISKVENKSRDHNSKVLPFYSLLIWDPDQNEEPAYFTNLPANYGELKGFLKIRGIDIAEMLSALKAGNVPLRSLLVMTHAIKRPYKVIGYEGTYEFFTYTLILNDDFSGLVNDEEGVCISSHSQPFTAELASSLSNETRLAETLYVGAGSLGSKIIMHDARSGKNVLGVVDHDSFQQHNIGRHVLFSNHVGRKKSQAVVEEIKAFYELDATNNFVFFDRPISFVKNEEVAKYKLIVDSTASPGVMHNLIERQDVINARYAKCEIVDGGEIGLLYLQGSANNPRMDDLIYLACYLAVENSELAYWRIGDADREQDVLDIGMGCSSVTNVMADDLISFHGAAFSQVLAAYPFEDFLKSGFIYLNVFRKSADNFPKISNKRYCVEPFEVYESKNDSFWTLRFLSGLSRKLLDLCNSHVPNETGGILIGIASYKTKTLHIYDVIEQPADSTSSPVAFNRGIEGLANLVDDIKYQTGQVIGYVGEWHTHPMNLETLSGQDMVSIEKLQAINKQIPIPTCAVIVTKNKIIPFVYD